MPPAARNFFDGLSTVAAALVVVGVWVQLYLIASYLFGADALDAHQSVGGMVHGFEALVFLGALLAWRGPVDIGHAFGLLVIGTAQLALSGSDKWIGGLHGLLALVVLILAVFIVKRGVERRKAPAATV